MNNPGKIVGEILLRQLIDAHGSSNAKSTADLEAKVAMNPDAEEVLRLLGQPGLLHSALERYQRGEDVTDEAMEKVLPAKRRATGGIYTYMFILLSVAAAVFSLFYYIIPHSPRSTRSIATIGAPKERTVHHVLSDGTGVWLNAGSSLSYPRTFEGFKKREVFLIGEAYFEVAPDKGHPFIIQSAHERVEVLGTEVDVSAYPDERFSAVSLLSGSVRVIPNGANMLNEMNGSKILSPGYQAWIDSRNPLAIRIAKMVDTRRVLSWRDASFDFDKTDLYTMMRQIGRWYEIDVAYDQNLPADTFTACFSKKLPLDRILHLLELTKQVRFTKAGQKVLVGKP